MAHSRVLLIVSVLILSQIAVAPTVMAGSGDPTDLPDDQIIETSDVVNVWEQSPLNYRVQTSDAALRVQNPEVKIKASGNPSTSLGKPFTAAFNSETELTFVFDTGNENLNNQNVQVVAARAEPTDGTAPSSFSDALDALTSENANENASYYFVNDGKKLDVPESGTKETKFTFEPRKAGHYAFFIAGTQDSDSISINNNKISINEDITVLGGDAVTVQRGSATVDRTTSNPQPGDTINFDVDASDQLAESGVTHAIAVYNQKTLRDSSHQIEIDRDNLDKNFNIEDDSEFFHSLEKVDGTATVEDGASVNGLELADGTVSRAVGAGAMVDFISEELNGNVPPTSFDSDLSTSSTTVLNASMDADVDEDGDHDLTIETDNDWETGTYEFVYMGAIENNKNAVSTQTGTFQLNSDSTPPPSTPPSETQDVEDGSASITFDGEDVKSVGVSGLPDNVKQVSVSLPSDNPTSEEPENSVATYFEINPQDDSGSVVNVEGEIDVEINIAQDTLSSINTPVLLHNPSGDNWEELSTQESGTDPIKLEATTNNGLSPFAAAEQTTDTEDDNEDDDDDDGSSGGGGGGGRGVIDNEDEQQDEEEEQQDGEEQEEQSPTVKEVREELEQTEPDAESQSEIVDNDPDRPGVNINPEGTESVREVTINNEQASGNLDVREWQDPPESVSQSVSGSLQDDQELAEEVAEEVETDSGDDGESSDDSDSADVQVTSVEAQVVTVADISPDSDEARESDGTVTMTADRDRLENPQDAVIVHESGDSWETLETTVEETSEDEVTLEADTDSFSLFAVAEVEQVETQSGTDDGEADDSGADDEQDDGPGSTTLIGLLVVIVLAVVATVGYRQMSQ